MLNTQSFVVTVVIIACVVIAWAFLYEFWADRTKRKLHYAMQVLNDRLLRGKNTPVRVLAVLANAMPFWYQREVVLLQLLNLVTSNSEDGLAELAPMMNPKHLRRVIKRWPGGMKKLADQGNGAVGQLNGKKLICFAVDTRTIGHLDSDLTAAEHAMLRDRFGIHQPLEAIESATG